MFAPEGGQVSNPLGSGTVFVLALGFLLVGGVLLLVPGVPHLAALHAFAAFIVLAVVAAANQLIPVLTGAEPAPAPFAIGIGAFIALGFALLIAGFSGAPTLAAGGAVLLASGLLWSAWTLLRLGRAPREGRLRALLALAVIGFVLALLLGGAMADALGRGHATPGLLALAPAHALLAIVVFGSTFVVTISGVFVPMFALAHTRSNRWEASVPWLVLAAGIGAAAGIAIAAPWLVRAALVLGVAAAAIALAGHLRTLRSRLRRRLDISLRYALTGWGFAIAAGLLALVGTWQAACANAAVACAVLGWLGITIAGYSYKIGGFLTWQYAKTRWPDATLPPLGNAVPETLARGALVLLIAGTVAIAIVLAAAPPLQELAYAIELAGILGVIVVLGSLLRTYLKVPPCPPPATRPTSSVLTTAGSSLPSR